MLIHSFSSSISLSAVSIPKPLNIISEYISFFLNVNNFLKNPQALQEVASGAGKTIITATLSHLCEKYGRTLVIVPNKNLVTQTEEDYVNCGLDVGVYFGDRKELGKTHTI